MDFQPPEPADLANVHALNRAFLDYVTRTGLPNSVLDQLTAELRDRLLGLSAEGIKWLAGSPFLIFSLAEQEATRWREIFDNDSRADLISVLHKPNHTEARLVSAALSFLWALANRRPYAARVVSGASLEWCERLADTALVNLTTQVADEPELLSFRMHGSRSFWRRLLVAGSSDEKSIRCAARLSALQSMLTVTHVDQYRRLPTAACSMLTPALKVAERLADDKDVSKPEARGYNTRPDESTVDKKSH